MLAVKLLWRNARSAEVKLLFTALLLAVAMVTAIGLFSDRLAATLLKQSNSFIGADRQIYSPQPISHLWSQQAQAFGLQQVRLENFSSMVFASPATAGDSVQSVDSSLSETADGYSAHTADGSVAVEERMQLAAIKAVEQGYPLVGQMEISTVPFATAPGDIEKTDAVPALGEAWVDSRLLAQLDLTINDSVFVGEKSLKITRVIITEPDRGGGFSLFAPRLMMNRADLDATEVIQPGSRIAYHWLLAGTELQLKAFLDKLQPELSDHHQLVDLERAQQGLASTLATARQFLLLAVVIAMLLAGIALVISSSRFAARHTEQVALLKSLGASSWKVRRLYLGQLLLLALAAAVAGLLLAEIFQRLIALAVASMAAVELQPASYRPYVLGVVSGVTCLIFFALPPLWHLPKISPLRILRQDLPVSSVRITVQVLLGTLAVLLLVYLFSGNIWLTLSVAAALLAVVLAAAVVALVLLRLSHALGSSAGSVWRLAIAGIKRRSGQSLLQVVVFAIALLLLLTMYAVRTSLIDEWQLQLPSDAPNHFLINIAPEQVDAVAETLQRRGLNTAEIYPMVRGRLVKINAAEPSAAQREKVPLLRREANISWSKNLPADNQLSAGKWWHLEEENELGSKGQKGLPRVSVESKLAKKLGVEVGAKLQFSFGGLTLDAEISSLRQLEWDNMKPNFYFIFEPKVLDKFSPMYMTSSHIPASEKSVVAEVLRGYPTIVVIEIDKVIEQIRDIVDKVGRAVEVVLALILVGGILVLVAAVNASIDSRLQEVGLIRALGSSRKLILGSLAIEFSLLGACAGVIAVLGSEALLLGLQQQVFKMPVAPHYELWLAGPLLGTLLVGSLGVFSCRRVLNTPPSVVLREVG